MATDGGEYGDDVDPELADRIARAWELHNSGSSARAIGRELGVSHPTVLRYLDMARAAETRRELVGQVDARRDLTGILHRLTSHSLTLIGRTPDPRDDLAVEKAIGRLERVGPRLERQLDMFAKITGAYAPLQVEAVSPATPQQNAISAAILRRRQERTERERLEIENAHRRQHPELGHDDGG